jgi:hypothetical protein
MTGSAGLSSAEASSTTSAAALRMAFAKPNFPRNRATRGKSAYFEIIAGSYLERTDATIASSAVRANIWQVGPQGPD